MKFSRDVDTKLSQYQDILDPNLDLEVTYSSFIEIIKDSLDTGPVNTAFHHTKNKKKNNVNIDNNKNKMKEYF